jgi:hypothetical protein
MAKETLMQGECVRSNAILSCGADYWRLDRAKASPRTIHRIKCMQATGFLGSAEPGNWGGTLVESYPVIGGKEQYRAGAVMATEVADALM